MFLIWFYSSEFHDLIKSKFKKIIFLKPSRLGESVLYMKPNSNNPIIERLKKERKIKPKDKEKVKKEGKRH